MKRKSDQAAPSFSVVTLVHRAHTDTGFPDNKPRTTGLRHQYGSVWIHSCGSVHIQRQDYLSECWGFACCRGPIQHRKRMEIQSTFERPEAFQIGRETTNYQGRRYQQTCNLNSLLTLKGRIQAQKDENGNDLGPLRVWMANIQMPGLAMTRSFGDKAGIRAGTNGVPEVLQHDITHEDKFIIVASDGVWEYLQNEEVMQLLTPFYAKNTLELGCERVVSYTTAVWRKVCLSRDDISIIVVSLNDP